MGILYRNLPDKWKEVGRFLEIPSAMLSAIETKNLGDPQKCILDMMDVWQQRTDPQPTWEDMAEAVEFVGREDIAQQIRATYCTGEFLVL